MSQATDQPTEPNTVALQERVEELESVLRTVLAQINTHQIYDKDARRLIRRALGNGEAKRVAETPQPARAREFPSMFPSATSNFV